MRIRTQQTEGLLTIQLEGRLTADFVTELEQCWRGARHSSPLHDVAVNNVIVNVRGVLSVDRAGRRLLQSMHSDGVKFAGAGLAMQDVLDEITKAGEWPVI